MKWIKYLLKFIKRLVMAKVYGNVKGIIKVLDTIALDIRELTVQADKEHTARQLEQQISTLKALFGIDEDEDNTTNVHGGGTGDD